MTSQKQSKVKSRNLWRNLFVVFAISSFVFFILATFVPPYIFAYIFEDLETSVVTSFLDVAAAVISLAGLGCSCMGTLITALGFVTTTALAWRKDTREAKAAALDRELKELEIKKRKRGQPKEDD